MEKDGKAEAETGSRGQGGEAREETRNQGGTSQGQQRPEQDRETPVCACTSTHWTRGESPAGRGRARARLRREDGPLCGEGGLPGLWPITRSTRAWLSSPTGCREMVGVTREVD